MSFPCTGCGLCCKQVGYSVAIAKELVASGNDEPVIKEVAQFPYATNEHGHCTKLNADNTCSVYLSRPLICSIDRTFEKFHSHESTREAYYKKSIEICNAMITEAGEDSKFLIKTP